MSIVTNAQLFSPLGSRCRWLPKPQSDPELLSRWKNQKGQAEIILTDNTDYANVVVHENDAFGALPVPLLASLIHLFNRVENLRRLNVFQANIRNGYRLAVSRDFLKAKPRFGQRSEKKHPVKIRQPNMIAWQTMISRCFLDIGQPGVKKRLAERLGPYLQ